MFLNLLRLAGLGLCALWAGHGAAQTHNSWELKNHALVGLDAWSVKHSAPVGMLRRATFASDQNTQWNYRAVSPWYQIETELNLHGQGQWVLKGRANQSTGAELNQLYYEHHISPMLGARVGVLDYRVAWCRSYDTDNPWVREADPFCSDNTIKLATASTPGIQLYTTNIMGDYVVQTLAGLYRPLLGNYATKEYSDAILLDGDQVTKNHKYGLTVNALNTHTASEWRLGWVGAKQKAEYRDPSIPPANSAQTGHLLFAGASWHLSPKVQARATFMSSHLKARITDLDGSPILEPRVSKGSRVLEINYQYNPRNALAVAYSLYPFEVRNIYKWQHESLSLAWRYESSGKWFTALQLTHARNHIKSSSPFAPVSSGKPKAIAIGFRLGYKL